MIQPTAIWSTPVSATARAVSGVMRPEASVTARPRAMETAVRSVSRSMLSSSTTSTPRDSATSSCSSVSTSSWICTMWPTPARARARASATPPASAMWLSLISTASSRPKRWLLPPPTRTAYFCSARRPGMVLRVQVTRAPVSAMARAIDAVAVATPLRWHR